MLTEKLQIKRKIWPVIRKWLNHKKQMTSSAPRLKINNFFNTHPQWHLGILGFSGRQIWSSTKKTYSGTDQKDWQRFNCYSRWRSFQRHGRRSNKTVKIWRRDLRSKNYYLDVSSRWSLKIQIATIKQVPLFHNVDKTFKFFQLVIYCLPSSTTSC